MQTLVRDLNRLYCGTPALHRLDCAPEGFRWVIGDDRDQSVFAWTRHGRPGDAPVLVVCNFTPVVRHGYGVPDLEGVWVERLNTDSRHYGGSDVGNPGERPCGADGLVLTLPPLATLFLERVALSNVGGHGLARRFRARYECCSIANTESRIHVARRHRVTVPSAAILL